MFFKKTTVKLMLPAFALGAFLAACSNDDPISDSKIETVAEVESLPDCNSKNEGEMVLVKKDLSLRVCVNKKWAEVTQNSDGSYDYKCETKALKDSSGLKIICGGDSIGVLLNLVGKDGDKGDQGVKGDSGVAGASCSAEVLKDFSGMKLVCGGDSVGVIRNGNDGDNGAGCSLKQVDENQLQIKCGDDSTTFYVNNGNGATNSSSSEDETPFEMKGASIWGNAIKGPYEVNTVVTLKEMRIQGDSLSYTGRSYTGSVSGLKGSFVIPNVTLDYPYAEVAVTGKWRNEVTGNMSAEDMTLYALTDLSDGHIEVNVNLLTHLEYSRVKTLIKKGYNIQTAKKQADNEIMNALGFTTDMISAENLATFVNSESEQINKSNATLLALDILFIRDKKEADIKTSIEKFGADLAADGKWDDVDGEKKEMIKWAQTYNSDEVLENISEWGLQDIPDFKTSVGVFWNNFYGLGNCNKLYDGRVKIAKRNDDESLHFICKNESFWDIATAIE